ncbi:MAG: SMP-30/gluconolactonase/LRE family protein, partial [Pseudomonadota bacterium]
TRRVIQRPAGAHGGTGQAETSFLTTDPGAFPDGAVTSADGRYWSANWGAGLIRITHADGTHADRLPVPASQPSCCAFGGTDLSILAVTSAREDLTPAALAAEPAAGNVFLYQTDAAGLPCVPYAGPLN